MAIKKKSVELSEKNIAFKIDKISYKVIRFYPSAMSLDVMVHDENGVKVGVQNIPFAHITKDVKKLIKPN